MSRNKQKTVIMISGRGSNMLALIEACRNSNYPAEIVAVISDNPNAGGLELASQNGIATHAYRRKDYASKLDHETAILHQLKAIDPEIICLAGYMRILSATFVSQYSGRILNIHPSLLPLFKGLNTHQRALDAGAENHGCSVHFVTEGLDDGPIIAQASIPVLENDTAEQLATRVIIEEHKLYPKALEMVAMGKSKYAGE